MENFNLYNDTGVKATLPVQRESEKINDPALYRPSKGLMRAVNVAIHLGQPLLLTGEPGTGKTRLADHVAYHFNLDKPLVFNAKTTSSVKDLFYRYDALGHFQYNQNHAVPLSPAEVEAKFIRYEALGKAIKDHQRYVVLIDEIDKAPRDLPNDILSELENLFFEVPEIGQRFETDEATKPFIIMTSNSEKNLPAAFLRRVAFYHIDFPDGETLLNILQSKMDEPDRLDLYALIKHFEAIRDTAAVKMQKKPATAELIYWAQLLGKMGFETNKLRQLDQMTDEDREILISSYSVLAKTKEDLGALTRWLENQ